MRKKYKLIFLIIVMLCWTMTCGMGLGVDLEWNQPILDSNQTSIYDRFDAAALIKTAAGDYKATEQKYKGRQVVISGKVTKLSEDLKSFWLKAGDGYIYVGSTKNAFSGIVADDTVWAYGRLSFGDEKKGTITLTADSVVKNSAALSADYYVLGGKSYSKSSADEVSIADGKIKFCVPSNWGTVEIVGDDKEKLFNVNPSYAKAYMLNSLRDKEEVEACCVFYFNSKENVKTDSVARSIGKIEREITDNICGGSYHLLAKYTDYTSYNTQFDRYVGEYGSYRVEFAFTPAKGGLCVIMYVYRGDSTPAADDVRFLQRTLVLEN